MTKRLIKTLIIIILIFSILYWGAVNILVSAVLIPSFMEKLDAFQRISAQSYAEQVQESSLKKNAAVMNVIGRTWAAHTDSEKVQIYSEDGYLLKGIVFRPAERNQDHRWAVLLHGYTGSKEMMYSYAYWYAQRGYYVLAPDFRCQGESDGDYIGLGATDSRDLGKWIKELILRRDSEAEIVLHGLSMGASTALIYAGEQDPPVNVKAVIADCAYTDAYAMFQEKIGSWFRLPAFPVVDSAELMIRLRAGYDLKETSPLKAVESSSIPTLFIHGREDRMIPVSMCLKLYNAAACKKEIMIMEEAGHAQAAEKDPVRYFETTEEFLEKYSARRSSSSGLPAFPRAYQTLHPRAKIATAYRTKKGASLLGGTPYLRIIYSGASDRITYSGSS